MRREELERMGQGHIVDILGEETTKECSEYGTGAERVENLKVAKIKLEARFEEIQSLFEEIAGDEVKEKEFWKKYNGEYHWLNEEIQAIEEELK